MKVVVTGWWCEFGGVKVVTGWWCEFGGDRVVV